MPGIWGCVDFSDTIIQDDIKTLMEKPFHEFKIDDFKYIEQETAIMGCAHQYIKVWSKNENLPYYDSQNDVLFTADCVIDNRTELILDLCPENANVPDGQLLYLALCKWGADMAKKVYGAYSYAMWDVKQKKLTLGVDHTACRALYYRRVENRVYFSTRMEAILNVTDKKLNEEWLGAFLAIKALSNLSNGTDTPYVDVFRMNHAHYNVFTKEKTELIKYYDFEKVKKIRYKTDEEYKEHFRKLYWQCVTQVIDGVDGKIGIMMTGGFDSSTVGSQVAIKLAEQGKNLYSYTNVPVDGFVQRSNVKEYIPDETQSVLKICKMYPNIIPTFLKSPEADGFSNIREIMKTYETPYKSMVNIDWIHSLYKKAGEDNCKMLLTGQCGNGTVSFGRTHEFYFFEKMRTGNVVKAFAMLNRFCKKNKFSRKKYFIHCIKEYLKAQKPQKITTYALEDVYLSAEKAKELSIYTNKSLLKLKREMSNFRKWPFHKMRRVILSDIIYAQTSEYDTAFSLKNGMVLRDPTRDVRIQEFCSAIPIECFVNDVPEIKRLVRCYCADLLPAEFLREFAPRGLQGSDWYERIEHSWQEMHPKVKEMLTSERIKKYVDNEKVKEDIEKYKQLPKDDINGYEFRSFNMLYGVGVFLEKHGF